MVVYCKDCEYRKETNLPNDSCYCERLNMYAGLLGCENGIAKTKTNADRIRAMTDEELAQFLDCICKCVRYADYNWHDCTEYDDCNSCWHEWLRKEYET